MIKMMIKMINKMVDKVMILMWDIYCLCLYSYLLIRKLRNIKAINLNINIKLKIDYKVLLEN